jgi:hypothetical protein
MSFNFLWAPIVLLPINEGFGDALIGFANSACQCPLLLLRSVATFSAPELT